MLTTQAHPTHARPRPRRRPRMSECEGMRARNGRWLRTLVEQTATLAGICKDEDVCARTVRRGVADAQTYPEMAAWMAAAARRLAESAPTG